MSSIERQSQWMLFAYAAVCIVLFVLYAHSAIAQVSGDDVTARRAQLENELSSLEAEIAVQQNLLEGKQQESTTLERDISILDSKIKKARLSIRVRDIAIGKLSDDITGKEDTIVNLNTKLDREKESLAQLLRRTNEIDDMTLVEIILGNQNLSDFFEDLDSFDSIKLALSNSFTEIEVTKDDTNLQKEILENKQSEELELRGIQELQKKKIEIQENQKQEILKVTKGVEAVYQKIIASKEKSAAEIRAELFTLRGSTAIPFEKALEYANFASSKTGVRPAFILGVIAEESNLGANVGTGSWSVDMHPTRDRPIFEVIARELGFDPNQMPVSKKPWYGWGGAMGPAQFIPSTWVCYGGFINTNTKDCSNSKRLLSWTEFWQGPWQYFSGKDRIRRVSGGDIISNPWDPRTAFIASALLLMDNGADRGTYYSERLAALRYFAGWRNAEKASYAFYGDEVMELAAKYQGLINVLASS